MLDPREGPAYFGLDWAQIKRPGCRVGFPTTPVRFKRLSCAFAALARPSTRARLCPAGYWIPAAGTWGTGGARASGRGRWCAGLAAVRGAEAAGAAGRRAPGAAHFGPQHRPPRGLSAAAAGPAPGRAQSAAGRRRLAESLRPRGRIHIHSGEPLPGVSWRADWAGQEGPRGGPSLEHSSSCS